MVHTASTVNLAAGTQVSRLSGQSVTRTVKQPGDAVDSESWVQLPQPNVRGRPFDVSRILKFQGVSR